MIQVLLKAILWLATITHAIGAVAIGLMMLQVTLHVFFQYVFSYPLPGTYLFVSNYYMVVVTFLCLAAVEMRDGHISVDILANVLPEGVRRSLACLSQFLIFGVFSLLTWQSWAVAESRRVVGTFEIEYGIKILLWPSYYVVPVGSALFAFVALVKLLAILSGQEVEPFDPQTDNVN